MEQPNMDEKWKLSKRASCSKSMNASSSSRRSSMATESGGPFLKSSASTREARSVPKNSSSSSSSSTSASTSKGISGRCANLVKEQRSKFYIVRRCVTMLICWRDYP